MDEHSSSSGDEERGSDYGEGYGPPAEGRESGPEDQMVPESSGLPQQAAGAEGGYVGGGQMSINSPSALDSWHGYEVDCPEPH